MTALTTLLEVVAVVGLVFVLPGLGMTRRWFPEVRGLEAAIVALTLGTFVTGFSAFLVAAVLHVWLEPPLIVAVAIALTVPNVPILARDARTVAGRLRAADTRRSTLRDGRRAATRIALAIVLPWLVFATRYSRDEFNLSCVNYAPVYVSGIALGDGSVSNPDRNDVLTLNIEQREGGWALLSTYPALFDFLGYRLSYAIWNTLSFGLAFLLGRRVGGRRIYGIGFAFMLLFNPLVMGIREIDENLVVLAAMLAVLYFLLRSRPAFFLAGLYFAFAFGVRHILILGVGGLALAAWVAADRRRALTRVAAGFALPSSFFLAHHWLTFGSPLVEESFRHFPDPVSQNLLGLEFQFHSVLAWPFTAELMRSPFNPLPALLQYAVAIPLYYGTVFAALVIAGALVMGRREPARLASLALLGLPTLGLLMVQGNWSETDKIRILLTVIAPLGYPALVGAVWMARGPRRGAAWALVAALALAMDPASAWLLQQRFSVDPREYVGRPALAVESPEDYAFMRRVWLRPPRPWPTATRGELLEMLMGHLGSTIDLAEELADRSYEARVATMPQRLSEYLLPELYEKEERSDIRWAPIDLTPFAGLETHLVRMDLSRPIVTSDRWLDVVTEPSGEFHDVAASGGDLVLRNRSAAGFSEPFDVLVVRQARRDMQIALLALVRRPAGTYAEAPTPLPDDALTLELHRGAQMFAIYFVNLQPLIPQAWEIEPTAGGRLRLTPSRV